MASPQDPAAPVPPAPAVPPATRRRRWPWIALAVVLVLPALLAAALALGGPPLARHYLQRELAALLHRPVQVGEVQISPLALRVAVHDLRIGDGTGGAELAGFDALQVSIDGSALLRGMVAVRALHLEHPRLHLVRNADGSYNVSDLISDFTRPQAPATATPAGAAPVFALANLQLSGGEISLDDRPMRQHHVLDRLELALPYLSNQPARVDDPVQPRLAGRFDGTAFDLSAQAHPFRPDRDATVALHVERLDLARLAPYVPVKLPVEVSSALLGTQLTATFRSRPGHAASLQLAGHVQLRQLALRDRDHQPLLSLPELAVDLAGLDVFEARARVDALRLTAPELTVTRDAHGRINLLQLLPAQPAAAPAGAATAPARSAPAFTLDLREVRISGGRVHWRDAVGRGFRSDVDGLEASLTGFALPQRQPARMEIALRTSQGVTLQQRGTVRLDPLTLEGHAEVAGVRPADYATYTATALPVAVASGTLRAGGDYRVEQGAAGLQVVLHGFDATAQGVQLRKRSGEPFLRLDTLALQGLDLDPGARTLRLRQVTSSGARVALQREADGGLDLARLAPPAAPAPRGRPAAAPRPWQWSLGSLSLERWAVDLRDLGVAPAVPWTVTALSVQVQGLGSAPGSRARFRLNAGLGQGRLQASGSLVPVPLQLETDLSLGRLALVPLQPYFSPYLNVLVRDGELTARGRLQVDARGGPAPAVNFRGEAQLNQLATVDGRSSEELLRWKSLFVGGIDVATRPLDVHVGEVALSDFFARILVHPDGHLNLQDLAATPAAAAGQPAAAPGTAAASAPVAAAQATATAPAAPAPRAPVRIDRITLQGGEVAFTDHFIKPNYSARLTDLGGSVTGLSSQLDTTGQVDLRGRLDGSAPLSVAGRINPLAGNLFADLRAQVTDIELGPLTPYSGKYVGYAIDKGKMSFNVSYHIQDRKLEAQNQIILNQLTFGERVESPTALKLPVQLAVALLRDRNGVIDINLPVSGSLNDPKFSIGAIIWKVVVNLVEKAVTAPFALLGSLFGGGSELASADFDAGRATLGPAALQRVEKLRKALVERPALKLEITPHVQRARDREGLREARFQALVRAQKIRALVHGGAAVPDPDAVAVSAAEYPQLVGEAYAQAKFPKPRNLLGLPKRLPLAEMEKLLRTSVEVGEDDLVTLANRRGQAAKDALVAGGAVAAERVFLVRPRIEDGGGDGKASPMRVDFALH